MYSMYVYVCMCMYVCMYVCIYVCIYACMLAEGSRKHFVMGCLRQLLAPAHVVSRKWLPNLILVVSASGVITPRMHDTYALSLTEMLPDIHDGPMQKFILHSCSRYRQLVPRM